MCFFLFSPETVVNVRTHYSDKDTSTQLLTDKYCAIGAFSIQVSTWKEYCFSVLNASPPLLL